MFATLTVICGLFAVGNVQATCPSGYTEKDGGCYLVSDAIKNEESAIEFCKSQNGHIVYINDAAEKKTVTELADSKGLNTFWTGGCLEDNTWMWAPTKNEVDCDMLTWAPNEPSQYSDEIYMYFRKYSDGWHIHDISERFQFTVVCEAQQCPSGYTGKDGGCYLLSDEIKNEEAAIEFCKSNDGHMVYIGDENEKKTVTELADSKGLDKFWTAGCLEGDTWMWAPTDNKVDCDMLTWAPNEPSKFSDEIYMYYRKYSDGWHIHDISERFQFTVVCEPNSNGKTYIVADSDMDLPAATKYCEDQGGNLVEILDVQERDAILALADEKGLTQFYTAGFLSDNKWVWSASKTDVDFTVLSSWATNEPSRFSDELYIYYKKYPEGWRLHDISYRFAKSVICEV